MTNIKLGTMSSQSEKEILKLIKTALSEIRFNNGRGYIFMDDIYGNKILHPVDTSIENKNFYEDATHPFCKEFDYQRA